MNIVLPSVAFAAEAEKEYDNGYLFNKARTFYVFSDPKYVNELSTKAELELGESFKSLKYQDSKGRLVIKTKKV